MATDEAATNQAMDEALDAAIAEAARILASARHTVALTGAGLSVESGIPPFRGKGGLWTKHGEPPLDGFQRFLRDPRKAWQERLSPSEPWLVALVETLSRARPNAGHRALAELERLGCCDCVITQNIDDLHRQAGTRRLLEIHGNHRLLRCLDCVTRFAPEEIAVDPEKLPPQCPRCGGVVKSDTVQFGEPIPPDVLRGCTEETARADCMLVAGTSATVYPAAEFPFEVLRGGGSVIEVNPEPTELTVVATLSLQGPGGAVLERLVRQVTELRAERAS
jgi:NAD-dependent deacetylase